MSLNEVKDKTGKIAEVPLGLSDHEQQVLNETRAAIANDSELDNLRDATLARYLRHNSWVSEPAIKQLKEYLAWRKANNVDRVLDAADVQAKETIRTVIPYAYHGEDKEGRPIYIEKTGMIATAALADPVISPASAIMHSHIYGVELLQKYMYENSLKTGKRVNGICTILDFNGLGFHHRACIHVLKEMMEFDSKYYPEYLGKLYVINVPWVGPYLYSAVQLFLDNVTKQRIQIISGDPSEFLLSVIDADQLPQEYGGNCTGDRCKHGGLGDCLGLKGCADVLDASKLRPAGAPDESGLDSQEISYDFEKVLQAAKEGDIFSWYFEVAGDAGYDIDFSVELLPASGVRDADPTRRVLLEKVQRLKTGKGSIKAPGPGAKILFRWDNNFSWMASKTIKYTLSVQSPSDALDQAFAHSAMQMGAAAAK